MSDLGSVSRRRDQEDGVHIVNEFVFDLELPKDFVPKNNDGKVCGFELCTTKEVLDIIKNPNLNRPTLVVVLDFLIRRGIVHMGNGMKSYEIYDNNL